MKKTVIIVLLVSITLFSGFAKTIDQVVSNNPQKDEMMDFLTNELGWEETLNYISLDWEKTEIVGTPVILCHLVVPPSDCTYMFVPFDNAFLKDYFVNKIFEDIRTAHTDNDDSTEAYLGHNGYVNHKKTYEDGLEEITTYIYINADEYRYSTFDFVYAKEINYLGYYFNQFN